MWLSVQQFVSDSKAIWIDSKAICDWLYSIMGLNEEIYWLTLNQYVTDCKAICDWLQKYETDWVLLRNEFAFSVEELNIVLFERDEQAWVI